MGARIALVAALLSSAVYMCTFRVYEYEYAIVTELGKIKRANDEPGLHFMVPMWQDVKTFDKRLQTLDAEPQRFLTGEKKDVIVDSFARWRIKDVVKFYKSSDGDAARAGLLIYQMINDSLRSEFGKRTVQEVVSGGRGAIMKVVTDTADARAEQLGMQIVDVRLKRIDLPTEVSSTVYERMRSERSRVAREFRARGEKEAITIRADADRQRTIIAAEAYRDAEILRGEGDGKAAAIYAEAYGKNPEFFQFYRSLNAYKSSFKNKDDVLVLQPDSEFFKYFQRPGGG
jgi:membrane protease subunit HflC